MVSLAAVDEELLFDDELGVFCVNNDRSMKVLSLRRGMNLSGRQEGELFCRVGESGVVIPPPACSIDAVLSRPSTIPPRFCASGDCACEIVRVSEYKVNAE